MPPRHAYWTIIVDDRPTSFRAHDVEELLPTFNRLREKHPSATLKWFERGQLWESREAAREAGGGEGERRWGGPRGGGAPSGAPRDRNWRPGGEHRDPRQKYKDAKKAKWDRYKQNIRSRWEEKRAEPVPDRGDLTPPHGDPIRPKIARDDIRRDLPKGPRGWRPDDQHRRPWKPKPPGGGGWKPKGKPRDKSGGWRPRSDDRRGAGSGGASRPESATREPARWDGRAPRKKWGSKPGPRKTWANKPRGRKKRRDDEE